MRGPQDKIPQRQLVYELATAVDRAMVMEGVGGDGERTAVAILDRLLDANPRSAFSTHVLHNIGPRRARWLRDREAARARAGVAKPTRATRSRPRS